MKADLLLFFAFGLLFLATLSAAQFPNATKYDFLILGCFEDKADRDLPTAGYIPSTNTNPTGITTYGGISLSFCGRVCQKLGYRYAGAQNGEECYCGNSYNRYNNKTPDSQCNVACSGDPSEKCGGSWRNTILDLSTVPGTVCPPYWPYQGSLCCPERASFKTIDQKILDDLAALFPSTDFTKDPSGGLTSQQLAQRQAYLSSSVSPNIYFVTQGSFNITILADGAGFRNQIGFFLLNSTGPILSTYQDIFGDASLDTGTWKKPNDLPWKSCIPRVGLTSSRGPFPAGTGIGFFLHADGASAASVSDNCKGKAALQTCLKTYGARNYSCYRTNGCSIDASKDPLNSLNTFSSVDSLNGDGQRHLAIIDSQYGLILGFEDMWDLGDKDYNDAMFLIQYSGEITGNFPSLCDPTCNTLNGKCNYTTGTCSCNAAAGASFDSLCNCNSCSGCSSAGGTCQCSGSSRTCVCNSGYTHSPAGNDCACSTDPGRCYGVSGTYNCGKCNCQAGYASPTNNDWIGGIHKFNFGTSTVQSFLGYIVESGSVISGTSFGSYGWNTDHTAQGMKYSDAQDPNSSIMKLKVNAEWSIYLIANKDYDVTITFGSQQASSHSLTLIGSTTVTVTDNLQLGANQYSSFTNRIRTTSTGKITLKEPGKGADLTRITSVIIEVPPCSCINCTGGCGSGVCSCYTGTCTCPPGFGGTNCQQCLSGYYGPNCTPCPTCNGKGTCNQGITGNGQCTCSTGWTGTNCNTCTTGYYGANCSICPSCVPNQGSCNQGLAGNGSCTCLPNFSGNLCQNCATGYGGASCSPCPSNCGHGSCSQGISGTGQCVCSAGWTGANCSTCATGYYGSSCTQCPTCNGKGTCNQGITGNGQCTCSTGWTGTNCDTCATGYVGTNCDPCHSTCATCSGTGANQCITCAPGLLSLGTTCVATCPTGYFRSGNSCLQCNPTCLTCFGSSASQCSTCNTTGATPYYQNGQCLPSCSSSYYVSGTNCNPCSQNCATCSGASTTCTSCTAPLSLSSGQCVNTCPNGAYSSSNVCQPCSQNCATCSGASSTCTSCPSGQLLYGTTCVATCPTGYYASGASCQPCLSPCATCSETSTNCTSCVGVFLYNPSHHTCSSNCSSTQFPSGTSCLDCDQHCATCSGPSSSSCTSCQNDMVLQNGQCLPSCSSSYYVSGTNCLPCDPSCATCSGTPTTCTSCTGSLALTSSSSCVSNCPDGTWKNGNTCSPCGGNCGTCTAGGPNDCVSCSNSAQFALQGSTCQTTCDAGFYENANGVCIACHPTCQTCSGPGASGCTSCPLGFLQYGTTCLTQCPPNTFENGISCTDCTLPCQTCSGASTTCTSCVEGATPYLNNGQCVSSCPQNNYLSGSTCLPCHDTCQTCNGGTSQSCTSCTGDLYLQDASCVSHCPLGTFANSVAHTCDPCSPSCLTCNGPLGTNCNSCQDSILDGTTCVPQCPPGKFHDASTNTCVSCFFTCTTCSNATGNDCLSCTGGLNLYGTECISHCPDGHYASDNECLPCDPNCATCATSATSCLSCPPGTYMLDHHCFEDCPTGYFNPKNGELVCQPCLPSRDCQNGGASVCDTGLCNCTGTGFSGPFCDCSTASCPKDASGVECSGLPCTCGVCPCDPKLSWGLACECKQCPGGSPCSHHGTCNCDGTCTCETGYVGADCSVGCIYDECGVCFGNGFTCAGCDGVPNSGKVFDACDICGGDNSTCAGCDGIPGTPGRPPKKVDRCGVCGGDGSSCRDQLLCEKRKDCEACNVAVGQSQRRECTWCNSTMSCVPLADAPLCANLVDQCSPSQPTAPVDNLTGNDGQLSTGVIIGAVMGTVVAAAVVAGLIYLKKQGKGPLHFEPLNLNDGPGVMNNPLYQEYSPAFDNPIYQAPSNSYPDL